MTRAKRRLLAIAAVAVVGVPACASLWMRPSTTAGDGAAAVSPPLQTQRAAASPVDSEAVEAMVADGAEPTRALAFDGETRGSEPPAASGRRAEAVLLETQVMPLASRRHPRLASAVTGPVSVGTVTAGYLVDAVEMPVDASTVRVLDVAVPRNTRYTTAAMRDLLLCAADAVAKAHPGAVLQLGNLSRMGGGPLPWSVSHHNGRDADLAFYVRDDKGQLVLTERLYHFDRGGRAVDAPRPLVFDVAANWTLVRSLLKCQPTGIQHLFIADWLKRALLAHARGSGSGSGSGKGRKAKTKLPATELALIARAQQVLHQPPRALPHNDHLHLRIGCREVDRSEGCVDAARARPETWGDQPSVQQRLPALRRALASEQASERADAVYLLGLMRDGASLAPLAKASRDADPMVRREVALVFAAWQPPGAAGWLAEALQQETDVRAAVAQLQALSQLSAVEQLAKACADPRTLSSPVDVAPLRVRWAAASLLGDLQDLRAGPPLTALLTDGEATVRDAARRALERLTNFSTVDLAGAQTAPPLEPASEQALWTQFWKDLSPRSSRDEVALRGLQRRAIVVDKLNRAALPGLVQALGLPAPWRDNAARWIERVVDYRPSIGRGARAHPLGFWPSFLVQRKLVDKAVVAARLAMARLTVPSGPATPASEGVGGAGGAAASEPD